MKLYIREDEVSAPTAVGRYIVDRINAFAPTPERPFVLGLPTGSSPEMIYDYLCDAHRSKAVSFANVVTFNMDEYIGLPEDHPQSYHTFMYEKFFNWVDIKAENIHILNGMATDLEAECADYERKIKAYGGIELFLGGIGSDGHIAFNEPGSSLKSRTRVVALADDTIQANARFFKRRGEVPRQAVTVGVGTIMDAREVVLIVLGVSKAVALQKTVEGGVSQMWTASCLQMHEKARIFCDEAATGQLLVKTYKFFKCVEALEKERQQHDLARSSRSESKTGLSYWRAGLNQQEGEGRTRQQISVKTDLRLEEDDDFHPDSMSSRLDDSAIGLEKEVEDESPEKFDRMSSRLAKLLGC